MNIVKRIRIIFLILFFCFSSKYLLLAKEITLSYSFCNYEKVLENSNYQKKEKIKYFIKEKESKEELKEIEERAKKIEEEKVKEELKENNNLVKISNEKVPLSFDKKEEKINVELNVSDISKILYATTSVNVRELPTKESKSLGCLSINNQIEATGICDNGWTRVIYKDKVAYINSKYLSETKIEIVETPKQTNVSNNQISSGYSGIIQREGNVSDSRLRNIEAYYCMIPQSVRTKLENAGWRYICSDKNFGAEWGYNYSILALTVYGESLIYIDNRKAAESAIIHEVGHALDCISGYVSCTEEFRNIFNIEKDIFCSVYSTHANNTSIESEYFAEAFQVFVTNPTLLQTNCPMTYEYITRYIN